MGNPSGKAYSKQIVYFTSIRPITNSSFVHLDLLYRRTGWGHNTLVAVSKVVENVSEEVLCVADKQESTRFTCTFQQKVIFKSYESTHDVAKDSNPITLAHVLSTIAL
jgi:hypothetical protein